MVATAHKTDPRKSPRQSRSQVTCAAILEAAARILESSDRQKFTTNHIAALAGVSVGSLYQYFPSKEAILAELIRAMRQDMLEDFEHAGRQARGRPLAEAVDLLVGASLRHHMRRPALAQALEREEPNLKLAEEIQNLKVQLRTIIVAVLCEHGIAEPERAAFDLSALARGLVDASVQSGKRDFEDLRHRLNRAVLGYLGLPVEALTRP